MTLDLTPALLDAALKGTAVLVLACALAPLLRRAAAAARHLLWTAALVGILALPALGLLLPRWHVHLPAFDTTAGHAEEAAPAAGAEGGGVLLHARHVLDAPLPRPKAVLIASRVPPPPAAFRPGEPPPPPHTPEEAAPEHHAAVPWPAIAWATGAGLSLAWLGLSFVSLWVLRRSCRPVGDGPTVALLGELAALLGVRRRVCLLTSDRRAVPMTWGVFRPVVLLPANADGWSAERLRLVLLHELGHVQRGDCLTQLLGHLARALYWFHPLAWLAVARLHAEQEAACDDVVLRHGAAAADYAEHLLAVTAQLPPGFFASPVALGMARADDLRRRLVALLDAGRDRRPVRRRGALLAAIAALGLLPLAAVGFGAAAVAPPPEEKAAQAKDNDKGAPKPLKRLDEVRKKLREFYVKPPDEKQLTRDAIRGMVKGLNDRFSEYLTPDELTQVEQQFRGSLTGIGVQLRVADAGITVMTALEGSPALEAGLRPGDLVESIDGKATAGLTMQEVVKRILGPAGEVVKLRVVHADGVVEEMPIKRARITIRTAEGFRRGDDDRWRFLLDDRHKVGYLRITQFTGQTAGEVREALLALKKDGLKGLLLDLRSCPGGLLQQAIKVCALFLKDGTILTTRGPRKEEQSWKADGKDYLGDFPLVVLLNGETASAAEIVAGALRDRDRAVLLGTRSYGKGSVQAVLKLDEGGALKITTAYHYLPSGRNIQKRPGEKTWGVDPTDGYYLPLTQQQTEALRRDYQRRSVLGLKKEDRPKGPAPLTPQGLAERHADPQLGAALRTMVARLTGGEFIKVGKSNAVLLDHTLRLEEMRQKRATLQQSLQQLDRDLDELRQVAGTGDKAPK